MRILHWYPNYFDEGGGVAVATASLALSQAEQGATVAIACAEQETGAEILPLDVSQHVELLRWHPTWRFRKGNFLLRGIEAESRRRLQAFRPDVVHVHSVFLPDNLWSVRLFDAPVIVSPRGGFHPVVFEKGNTLAKQLYVRLIHPFYYRHAAAFHALDPDEARHIAAVVPSAQLFTVPQGPNRATMQAAPTPPLPRDPAAPVRFIFVGRLHIYTKGIDVLLEAFAQARALTSRPIHLYLVGPDHEGSGAKLRAQAEMLGIADAVTFTGAMPGNEVLRHLHEADAYVQLSRHEGFSLSVAEALTNGKPAVLTDRIGTVSYPELADLPHIFVVPLSPSAAAEAIAEVAGQIEPLQEAARTHFDEINAFFSWPHVVEQTQAMYESVRASWKAK